MNKNAKRKFTGTVVSDAMQKTRVVEVSLQRTHPRYERQYTVRRRFKAHDEKNASRKGDRVIIQETRPISKDKHFAVIEILNPDASSSSSAKASASGEPSSSAKASEDKSVDRSEDK